eukprot:jgi/Antlo1/273/879
MECHWSHGMAGMSQGVAQALMLQTRWPWNVTGLCLSGPWQSACVQRDRMACRKGPWLMCLGTSHSETQSASGSNCFVLLCSHRDFVFTQRHSLHPVLNVLFFCVHIEILVHTETPVCTLF